jgi:DNA-binding NtrC family response regulator
MAKTSDDFRILIVDDNKDLRDILQEYLDDQGDLVDGASDGNDALTRYRAVPYDLIITDLNMPGTNGIDLIKQIKEQNDMTEFIIITGYASLDSAVEAVKIGAFDYIVKPFRMEELKVVVKNARDKVILKKVNRDLFRKLKMFYDEIERYKLTAVPESPAAAGGETLPDVPAADTEKMINEIRNLDRLRKGRLLID